MIDLTRREECCGCSACSSVCPKDAISMTADAMGFKYPVIDDEKCIHCGLCERACSFKSLVKNPLEKKCHSAIYACRMRDMEEVAKSQSGAATAAVANWILDKGGVVYGAAFGEHFSVHHTRATTKEERDAQRKSKYVQSDIEDCFLKVKEDLKDGKTVLFTGTGCQVAGLLQFAKAANLDTKNLYTCDIICHGVPSPRLWQDYVNYVEQKKLKKPIVHAEFRDKTHYGWASHKETFYTTYTTYTYIFYDHVSFRPSCAVCPYASTNRLADFTVCDFWGYEKSVPEMGADDKGLSLMFVSSEKAKRAFEEFSGVLNYKAVEEEKALQSNMIHPSVFNVNAARFEEDYIAHGFEYVMKKYGHAPFSRRCKNFAKRCVRKILGERGTAAVKKMLGKK